MLSHGQGRSQEASVPAPCLVAALLDPGFLIFWGCKPREQAAGSPWVCAPGSCLPESPSIGTLSLLPLEPVGPGRGTGCVCGCHPAQLSHTWTALHAGQGSPVEEGSVPLQLRGVQGQLTLRSVLGERGRLCLPLSSAQSQWPSVDNVLTGAQVSDTIRQAPCAGQLWHGQSPFPGPRHLC